MAAYLALWLTRAAFEPGLVAHAGEPIKGWSISTSEDAEVTLEQLHVITRDAGQPVLALSTDALPGHFASGAYDAHFGDLLEAYLSFVDWNGDVPTRRAPFSPPAKHQRILALLADLGYLTSADDGYRWTDLAGPAMLCAGAWTPDFRSHAEVRDEERDAQARRIVSELPNDLRKLAQTDPIGAYWPVHNALSGPAWHQIPDKALVERVIELAQVTGPLP